MQKTLFWLVLCTIVLVGVASAQTVVMPCVRPGVAPSPSVTRIAYLEDKVAQLESAVQNGNGGCDAYCGDTCDNCCGSYVCDNRGIIGGYDFLWLKPHFGDSVSYYAVTHATDTVDILTDFGYPTEYKMAPRFWFGYQGCNGLGVRVRYAQYDQSIMNETITAPTDTTLYYQDLEALEGHDLTIQNGMELHVLDLDITKDFEWRCAKLTAGAGVRYGKVLFDSVAMVSDVVLLAAEATEQTFEGCGPTAFVDFKAPVRSSAVSVVGGLRGSVLFGRSRGMLVYRDVIGETTDIVIGNGNRAVSVLDASIGLQYDRCLTNGVDGFVRFSWEGQMWYGVGSPTDDDDNMAMEGLCVGVGITR